MIALKVSRNGHLFCTAGAEDLGVVNTIVLAKGVLGAESKELRPGQGVELMMNIGGMTSRDSIQDDHLSWESAQELRIGDRIEIEFVETTDVDTPTSVRPVDTKESEQRLKEQYEYAKAIYLQFKDKFDDEQS